MSISTPIAIDHDAAGAAVPSRTVIGITAAGLAVAAAAAYNLSPMTAWLTLAVLCVIYYAVHDLRGGERRWIAAMLLIALAVRLLAVAAIALRRDPAQGAFSTIFGDGLYALKTSLWIRNVYLGIPIAPRDYLEVFDINYGRTSYHNLLAALQVLWGPSPYGAHVLSTALYMSGAVSLYRRARCSYGPLTAALGLLALLYLPTLFLWSIVPLKESVHFFCTAIALTALITAFRARSNAARAGALVVVAVALVAINSLRSGGLVMAGGGLLAGLVLAVVMRRPSTAVATAAIAPIVAVYLLSTPAVHDRLLTALQDASTRHLGHVGTPGTSYRLLDDEAFYRGARDYHTLTYDEGLRFAARSVVSFVVEPKPWNREAAIARNMAPQQLLWYGLVVLAFAGVVAGMRRDVLFTSLLVGIVALGVAVIAPNSGNVGTLIRHRDMVVPFVIWLSAAGATSLLMRLRAASPSPGSWVIAGKEPCR